MQKPSREVLFIAYVFPPIAYAGTFRSLRLCKYLARLDYAISVLTINKQTDLYNDPALLGKIENQVEIHRTRTIDLWRFYQPYKKRLGINFFGRILNKLICLFLDLVNQPDHMVLWVPFAIKRGMTLCKNKHNLVLYTSSPPHSEHWIGYLLKKLYRQKWVADLRDPIMDNIAAANWNSYQKATHHFLEQRVLHNADAVIVNTKTAQKKLKERYPAANIVHIGNSFDAEDFEGLSREKFPVFTLSHVGSIYNFRKIDVIWQTMKFMQVQGHITPKNFRLLLVGLNDKRVEEEVAQSGLSEFVEIRHVVSHREALEIMLRSHLLLLIKGFGAESLNQIPGKLFEYLGSSNPILYVGPTNCDAADIIRSMHAGIIAENNTEKVQTAIMDLMTTKAQTASVDPVIENLTSQYMAQKFHDLIESL